MGAPGKFDTAESLSVVGCVGLYYSQALLFCFQFCGDIFEVMTDESKLSSSLRKTSSKSL